MARDRQGLPMQNGDDASAADIDPTMTEAVLRVPVYEEALTATKTVRTVGRFEKIVVVEDPGLDLSSTEERLKVVRRTVKRSADGATSEVIEAVLIDVPLNLAALELRNEAQMGEEIAIWKEAVQRTEHVTGTVRREEVTITELTAGALVDGQERRP